MTINLDILVLHSWYYDVSHVQIHGTRIYLGCFFFDGGSTNGIKN